jgi:glycine betaine/proline transport system ATP-binding protein|tara:strand:+ start:2445 stop:3551 length:1107 start_codon:yes stop_codon:yes gene_type:complete
MAGLGEIVKYIKENTLSGNLGAVDPRPIKLECKNLWKLFGYGEEAFVESQKGIIDPENLKKSGLIAAVQDATFEVFEGEMFIVMGLSGSGKSTLLRCLSRLVEPSAGELVFDGQDLLKVSDAELIEIRRHKMGMVFQHFALLPHLNVRENVAFPLMIQGIDQAERYERADAVIELVGLKGRESDFPAQLSGGQQQRVGIARSLSVEPQIWFLDEPFSALDPLIRREMQAELLRLQQTLKKTIVFITHDFDEAIRLADRIAIMKDGKIIQIGTAEELVNNPKTDYVADFTRDVNRAKVLSARSLMQPISLGFSAEQTVVETAKISSFSAEIVDSVKPFGVVSGHGEILGMITAKSVIDLLAGKSSGGQK